MNTDEHVPEKSSIAVGYEDMPVILPIFSKRFVGMLRLTSAKLSHHLPQAVCISRVVWGGKHVRISHVSMRQQENP